MSKAEILEELPKLTPRERQEVRARLNELDRIGEDEWLDESDPLTEEEKALIEARLADMDKHPEKSIPWAEAEVRLKARFGE